jgi:hypothetical protein
LITPLVVVDSDFIIGMAALILGAPVLNFLLAWTRRKADKDNTIVSGAGEAVSALSESLRGVRGEVTTMRDEITELKRSHASEITDLTRRYQRELESVRTEHRDEIRRLEERHVQELSALEKRLSTPQPPPQEKP